MNIVFSCLISETTNLCKMPCQNNGRCNQNGECECPQGYHGQFCEIGKYTSFPVYNLRYIASGDL